MQQSYSSRLLPFFRKFGCAAVVAAFLDTSTVPSRCFVVVYKLQCLTSSLEKMTATP
jgi:hypothetical protein